MKNKIANVKISKRLILISASVVAAAVILSIVLLSTKNKDAAEVFAPDDDPPVITTTAPATQTPPKEEEIHEGTLSPLTGLYVDDDIAQKRPVAIMINNFQAALPQYGISRASIVYECLAEGGITRLMCVMNDYEGITQLGPVRSARDYYAQMAQNHPGSIYIHYGKSPQAQALMQKYAIKHIDGISYLDTIMFWRDSDRVKKGLYEHSAFTSGERIDEGLSLEDLDLTTDDMAPSFDFYEKDTTPVGERAGNLKISYSYYIKPEFKYDEETKEYLRFQFGEKHTDALYDDVQLSFKNVIIIETSIKDIPKDPELRIEVEVTGEHRGYYFTNGVYKEITYKKADVNSVPKYYDKDGGELKVNPGKTFISYVSSLKSVTIEN